MRRGRRRGRQAQGNAPKWGIGGENARPQGGAWPKTGGFAGRIAGKAGEKICNRPQRGGGAHEKTPKRFAIRRVFVYDGTIYMEKDAFA